VSLFLGRKNPITLDSTEKDANKFKIGRQQHNSTSNFVSDNSLIAKFIRYDTSSIASLCVNV
jgi:hypothetical protein